MNILEFEVDNQVLKRIDSQDIVNNSENIWKCQFTFDENSEWVDINKFVIFKDGWGNTSTVHLGNENNVLSCYIPNKVLRGSYFYISVFGGGHTTNNVSIALIQSGYKPHCASPYYKCGEKDIFREIFKRLDKSVDSIVYDRHILNLYCKDKLLESIYLPFLLEDEFSELVEILVREYVDTNLPTATNSSNGLLSKEDKEKLDSIEEGATNIVVDTVLDEESSNPISNSTVTKALNMKEDSYDMVERLDDLIVELINNGE